jgi:hypothetical protein
MESVAATDRNAELYVVSVHRHGGHVEGLLHENRNSVDDDARGSATEREGPNNWIVQDVEPYTFENDGVLGSGIAANGGRTSQLPVDERGVGQGLQVLP